MNVSSVPAQFPRKLGVDIQKSTFKALPQDVLELRFSGRVKPNRIEQQAEQFIQRHVEAIQQLAQAAEEAKWDLTCQGGDYIVPGKSKPNHQRKTETDQSYKDYFSNPDAFAEVQALLLAKDKIADRLLVRQLEELFKGFEDAGKSKELLEKEKALMDHSNELTGIYNAYRGIVDGQKLSQLEITHRLEKADNPQEAKQLWLANTGHGLMTTSAGGAILADSLQALAKQRNAVARLNKSESGKPYSDYFSRGLAYFGINEESLVQLLDQVDEATRQPYQEYRKALEAFSQKHYGISNDEAKLPWYGAGNLDFYGTGHLKRLLAFDLQPYLKGKDPLVLLKKTAQLMGDDLQPVLSRSSYVKNGETRSSIYFDPKKDEGKSQHWFSFSINPPFDVRTFGSVDPEHNNMMDYVLEALLHEAVGHGLDGIHLDPALPYLMRKHHSITKESNAMLLESLLQDADWMHQVVGLPKAEAEQVAQKSKRYHQAAGLEKIRYILTVIQFERQMYKNPDQDLNQLWWNLQERYMGVKRPQKGEDLPGFASIPHFYSHPVFYQNYFLADLSRAQKLEYIQEHFKSLLTPEAGDYLRTYRKLGNQFDWDDLIERMTGKPLDTKALQKEVSK